MVDRYAYRYSYRFHERIFHCLSLLFQVKTKRFNQTMTEGSRDRQDPLIRNRSVHSVEIILSF